MRIIADYRSWGDRNWGFLPTVIEIKDLKLRGRVDFLLDTGAGETILSEKDAQRISLNYRAFSRGKVAHGVGGTAGTWEINKEVTLYMLVAGNSVYTATRRWIEVLEEPNQEKTLPSLLGLEFLEQLDFKLTFDMATGAVFLER